VGKIKGLIFKIVKGGNEIVPTVKDIVEIVPIGTV
jgi:hypothetical protein